MVSDLVSGLDLQSDEGELYNYSQELSESFCGAVMREAPNHLNSPGKTKVVPKRASEAETAESSLGTL